MKDNRSVNRLLAILELISQHDEGLTLGQIYRELDMPKATAYDFLQTLYKADAVYYKDPRLKNYVIGSKMFAIGSVYTTNSNLIEASSFDLKTFADQHGKTVFISKKIENQFVYVYKYHPSSSLIAAPYEIGTIINDFNTHPVGLVFKAFNKKTKDFNEKLEEVKKQGYAESDPANFGHMHLIAVPVKNFENRVVGVISMADLQREDQDYNFLIKELTRLASNVSKRLGYLGE